MNIRVVPGGVDLVEGTLALTGSFESDASLSSVTLTALLPGGEQVEVPTSQDGRSCRFELSWIEQPVSGLTFSRDGDPSPIWQAENLFHSSDAEFEQSFKSKRDRVDDPRLEFYSGMQNFKWFSGSVGYRLSSAVVCAYKSVELLDESYLLIAENQLLQCLVILPTSDVADSPRHNREHLHISILCALWHVYLAQGKLDQFVATLSAIRALVSSQKFHSYFNLSFNASLSLRVSAVISNTVGDIEDGAELAKISRNLFKLASRDATGNLAHFKELGYVHGHAYEVMRLARLKNAISEAQLERNCRQCFRIPADQYSESFSLLRANLMAAAEMIGRAANEQVR